MSSLFLDALQCRNFQKRPPVWLMRQAGRYMPQYRALREKYSFLEMCHQPELIAEVTQLPLAVFGFDAAILFSDILVIPEALGIGLRFEEQVGPIIERPIRTTQDLQQLPSISADEKLNYVKEGIQLLKRSLKVPLIGFCGGPFTVASYMIEGKSSRDLKTTKKWMVQDPSSLHLLLQRIAKDSIDYLNLQIDAGVDAIQIFDSWAHVLSDPHFREFSLRYMETLMRGLKKRVPVILFCRGSSVFAKSMATASPAAISIDWNADLAEVRKSIPASIALQGNLDPDILYAPKETVKAEVRRLLNRMQGDPGYIFNLGHGIHPDVPVESVHALVEEVKS